MRAFIVALPLTIKRKRAQRRAALAGFTLVEIIVVVAVVAVVTALAVPRLAGTANVARLRSATSQMLSAARYAKHYAVTRRVACRLTLDIREKRYSLEYEVEPGRFQPLTTGPIKPTHLPPGIEIVNISVGRTTDAYRPSITFHPTGHASGGRITLGQGGHTKVIQIEKSSGRVFLHTEQAVNKSAYRLDLDA